jgi:hypothetical protein
VHQRPRATRSPSAYSTGACLKALAGVADAAVACDSAQLRTMLYKFKSQATGDLIMLGPQGDQMLRLLGREPATQGIIEVAAMPAALLALQTAITNSEQAAAHEDDAAPAVGLRQRLWPMVEMLRQAHAANAVVVWGV